MDLPTRFSPLVVAVRWGTVVLGLAVAALNGGTPVRSVVAGVPLVAYALYRTFVPLRYVGDDVSGLLAVLGEVALSLAVVVATGFWASPYVFCAASAILAAGFSRGFGFAIRTALAGAAAVAIPYHFRTPDPSVLVTIQWSGELLLIALVAGYARRLFGEAEEEGALAMQANVLLTQLTALAQTLPASLDLDQTVMATLDQLRQLFPADVVAVLLWDESAAAAWTVAAASGARLPTVWSDTGLPEPVRSAAAGRRAAVTDRGPTLSAGARSGLYVPLLARQELVGILAVESRSEPVNEGQLRMTEAIASQAALALDNARWFSRLRAVGADEERTRIARDLHDRVGQGLAFVAFELDRISRVAAGQAVEADLVRLRGEVRNVVTEVRDTLYDLRTDVTEGRDFVTTTAEFLDRVRERSSLDVHFDFVTEHRLPLRIERELWRIVQEAVTNAVRHSGAAKLQVTWECGQAGALLEIIDDGRGVPESGARADAFGLVGMRERAAAIGADFEVHSPPGTTIRCRITTEAHDRR